LLAFVLPLSLSDDPLGHGLRSRVKLFIHAINGALILRPDPLADHLFIKSLLFYRVPVVTLSHTTEDDHNQTED
jgi:hypothetical protein